MKDMDDMHLNKKRKKRILVLLFIAAALSLLVADSVSASRIGTALSGAGSRAGGAISGWLTAETPGMFDFVLFGIMFFALCWIGFQKWLESAKGAAIALSVTLAIALSAALVFGGKIGVKRLLPFASLLLFLLVVVGIAFILQKFVFKSESALSKVLTFVVAVVLAAIMMGFLLSSLCGESGCEKNPLLSDLFGATSIFGKLGGWFDGILGDSGAAPGRGSTSPSGGAVVPGGGKAVDESLYNEANAFASNPDQIRDNLERANKAQSYLDRLR
jgi:hypothetical protein